MSRSWVKVSISVLRSSAISALTRRALVKSTSWLERSMFGRCDGGQCKIVECTRYAVRRRDFDHILGVEVLIVFIGEGCVTDHITAQCLTMAPVGPSTRLATRADFVNVFGVDNQRLRLDRRCQQLTPEVPAVELVELGACRQVVKIAVALVHAAEQAEQNCQTAGRDIADDGLVVVAQVTPTEPL